MLNSPNSFHGCWRSWQHIIFSHGDYLVTTDLPCQTHTHTDFPRLNDTWFWVTCIVFLGLPCFSLLSSSTCWLQRWLRVNSWPDCIANIVVAMQHPLTSSSVLQFSCKRWPHDFIPCVLNVLIIWETTIRGIKLHSLTQDYLKPDIFTTSNENMFKAQESGDVDNSFLKISVKLLDQIFGRM